MNFIKSNPHPTGKKIGDCVIRAIAIATNQKWIDVYKELCRIGAEKFNLPNSKQVYDAYLLENGWIKKPMPRSADGRRMKLRDFIEGKKGIKIARTITHLVAIEDDTILDTWDCSSKCVGNYYVKCTHPMIYNNRCDTCGYIK